MSEGSQGIEHLACLAPLWASCRRLQGGDGDGDGSEEEEEDVCGDGHQHRSPPSHITLIRSQPFHGVHRVGDSLLFWTTFEYDKRDSQPTKALNKLINIKDSHMKMFTENFRLELLQLLELPFEDREVLC